MGMVLQKHINRVVETGFLFDHKETAPACQQDVNQTDLGTD
jgi:hypothetical protein